jgi:hypothetical protein
VCADHDGYAADAQNTIPAVHFIHPLFKPGRTTKPRQLPCNYQNSFSLFGILNSTTNQTASDPIPPSIHPASKRPAGGLGHPTWRSQSRSSCSFLFLCLPSAFIRVTHTFLSLFAPTAFRSFNPAGSESIVLASILLICSTRTAIKKHVRRRLTAFTTSSKDTSWYVTRLH